MFRPAMLAIFMVAPKAVTLQVRSGPEGCRKLRFPVFMTTVQDSGKVVRLTHLPSLTPVNAHGTHFLLEDSPPQVFEIWHVLESIWCLYRSTLCRCCLSVPAAVQPTPQHTISCLCIDWSKLMRTNRLSAVDRTEPHRPI